MLLIRHGETEWNVAGRWQGSTDSPLTATGYEQAFQAATALGEHGPFAGVWSSDLTRAAITGDLIAIELGLGDAHRHPGLREAGIGPWEGLTHAEIEQQWPGHLAAARRPPGAEDHDVVLGRVTRALGDISREQSAGDRVVVVAHAGVLRMLRRAMQLPDVRYGNLSGYWLDTDRRSGQITIGSSLGLIGSGNAGTGTRGPR